MLSRVKVPGKDEDVVSLKMVSDIEIEGDKLNVLDARTKLRLEAFLDMLVDQKELNI